MWSVTVRWAVGGKKKAAAIPRWTSFIYRCPPLVHWISTRIEWAIERDDNHNRETARISAPFRPVLLRSTLNFASFLLFRSFFLPFFIRQSKERKKGKKEERVRAFERLVREIVASSPSSLLGIFSRRTFENREGTAWNHASLFSSLPLSRRKTFSLLHVSRASMESRFLKRSGMGETREIFNRNRLDRTIRPVGKIA